MTASGRTPRRTSSGSISAALPSTPTESGLRVAARALDHRQRFVQVLCLGVEIAGLEPHLDARRLAFDRQQRCARHGRGERLRAAHAAEPGGENPSAGKVAAVVAPPDFGEGLVGALHDALRADVDPRARGHLAVHHQAFAIELVEMVQRRPVRHEVRVGDQHARRVRMGAKHADRLSRLHAQRLVRFERREGRDDAIEALPVARGAADAAVDHELMRLLGHLGVEVVHQHPQRRLGQPALGGKLRAARRPDDASIVETGGHRNPLQARAKCEAGFEAQPAGSAGSAWQNRHIPRAAESLSLGKIAAHGELHLDRMDAIRRSAVGAGDPAAGEATVDDMRPCGSRRKRRYPLASARNRIACPRWCRC